MSHQASGLPPGPSLEQLSKQAEVLLAQHRAGDPGAADRLRVHLPQPTAPSGPGTATLADARCVTAREHGFKSWLQLDQHFERIRRPADYYEAKWGRDTWPFLVAVYEGRGAVVRQMLAADPKLVRMSYAYLEPLHYAVMAERVDMVRLLLDAGGNPLAEGWMGKPLGDDSPLARARDREREDLVQALEAGVVGKVRDLREREEDPLDGRWTLENEMSWLAHRGDLAGVRDMLRRHPDFADAGLYEAAHQGYPEVVGELLQHGADPKKPWRYACWYTPLMHSLRYPEPRWEIAELLLAHGVTPNDRSGMGIGTLHILAAMGTLEAVAWLLDRGAEIHQRDLQFDSTPLAWAARAGRAEMVRFLLSRGATAVHPEDEPWARPGAWARRRGHLDIVTLLAGAST